MTTLPLDPLDWLARDPDEDLGVDLPDGRRHEWPALWDDNGGAELRRRATFVRRVRDDAELPRGVTPPAGRLLDALGFLPGIPLPVLLDLADWVNYRLSLAIAHGGPIPEAPLTFLQELGDLAKVSANNILETVPTDDQG
ncbi:hypothetical protein SAMN05216196_102503 [Lutimaribacter pacificus]|uniref:Uncharacterized protein n=1 Tax=Lutimaribacter pacificus TaxID=391948 RepID=A0A1H0F7G0_9RHOB|nr:hypothetical protein [Lutimaribacter pacificus]SDN90618.1 hypothetical protein SAMN05216196_102503 [Lutimaribacter pacificus]SHK45876.1 hypothetical protein SAMN05444142_105217 [Lutimaribacter pacificus]